MKKELEKKEDFKPGQDEKKRVAWIILMAFVILATLGVVVWLVFSGRANQTIHG